MVIGFLLNTCEPFYRGGYERRVYSFARELVRQGHTVRLYTSCPRREKIEGVDYIPIAPLRNFFNAQGVRNGWADLFFLGGIGLLFWRWRVREVEVLDVCATPFLHLPLVALLCRWKKIPVICTCHEALRDGLPAYARERGWRFSFGPIGLLRLIYDWGMRALPARLAVSPRTAEALQREGYAVRTTVEFGLEPDAFAISEPEAFSELQPATFVFCGRLAPIKNVQATLRALQILAQEKLPFHFHILGDGTCRAELEALARPFAAQVTFHGEVTEEVKRCLLAQSEVFVLSSPREGFSIATLEAMAQGCAAMILHDPALANGALDFVRDGQEGWVVPAQSKTALADALREAVTRPEERLKRRRTAWQHAQTYRLSAQTHRLAEAYRALVSLPLKP